MICSLHRYIKYLPSAMLCYQSDQATNKCVYAALQMINPFPFYKPFLSDKDLQASCYLIAINMASGLTSCILYSHQFRPSQRKHNTPRTVGQIVRIRLKMKFHSHNFFPQESLIQETESRVDTFSIATILTFSILRSKSIVSTYSHNLNFFHAPLTITQQTDSVTI